MGRSFCPSNHNCRSQRGAGFPGMLCEWVQLVWTQREDLTFGMICICIYISYIIYTNNNIGIPRKLKMACLGESMSTQNLSCAKPEAKKWDPSFYNDYTDWSVMNRSLQGSFFSGAIGFFFPLPSLLITKKTANSLRMRGSPGFQFASGRSCLHVTERAPFCVYTFA